jgi:GTP-binding protein
MRREGFELEVGPPSVIIKENEAGQKEEPWESVEVRVPEEYVGGVVDLFNQRKGELQDMGLEEGEGMSVVKYPFQLVVCLDFDQHFSPLQGELQSLTVSSTLTEV